LILVACVGMLGLVVLSILMMWVVCAAVCVGVGALVWRVFAQQQFGIADAFWMGLAGSVALLEMWHFARPVDWAAAAMLAGLGACGLVTSRGRWRAGGWRWAEGALVIAAAGIVALRSAAPCEHYDTGLYGAQAVRWFTTFRLVPGLGNLIAQMGFNSSVFLCVGTLEQGPLRGAGHHLFVGFLVAALLAMSVRAGMRVWRGETSSAAEWFLTLLFVPGAIAGAMGKLSGTNSDLPTTVVVLVGAWMLVRGLESGDEERGRMVALAAAMILFSVAVTFKISSAVFALGGWVAALVALRRMGGGDFARRKRVIGCAVALTAAIVGLWIARGLVLTGYPFFPSSVMGIAADWKVPAGAARVQLEFAQSFARVPVIPLADTSGWRWLRPWARELVREREGFLIPAFFMLAGAVVMMLWRRAGTWPRWLWVVPAALAGLVFWFFGAPAMRFGEPMMWTAGAALGAFAAVRLLESAMTRRIAIFALVVMTAWAAHPRLLWGSYFRPSLGVRTLVQLPEAKVESRRTASGLGVYVPVETNQCWDAALPCSPYVDPSLRLREAGNMKAGFAVGASAPQGVAASR
jgi:hypothetical protein